MSNSSQLGESIRTVESQEDSVTASNTNPKAGPTPKTKSGSSTQNNIIANRFQTRWCKSTQVGRQCPYGHRCMFAHSPEELRTVEMNLRDGITSEIAIKAFRRRQREAKLRGQLPIPGSAHPAPLPVHQMMPQWTSPVAGAVSLMTVPQQPGQPPQQMMNGQSQSQVQAMASLNQGAACQPTPNRGRSGSFASSFGGDLAGSRRSGSEDRFSSSAASFTGSYTNYPPSSMPSPNRNQQATPYQPGSAVQSNAGHSVRSDSPYHLAQQQPSSVYGDQEESAEEQQSFDSFLAWNNCQGSQPGGRERSGSPGQQQHIHPHRQPTKKQADPESSDTSGYGGDASAAGDGSGGSRSNQGLSAEGGNSNASSSSTGLGSTPQLNNRRNQRFFQKMFPPWTHTPYPTVQWVYNPNCDCQLCRSQRRS